MRDARRCRTAPRPAARCSLISVDRGLDDGERLEAEEVELDQAGLLDVVLVELGDDLAVLAAEAGHVLPQRLLGDHDAGGVHAGVAVQPLERMRDVEQLAVLRRSSSYSSLELAAPARSPRRSAATCPAPARAPAWRACRPRRTGCPWRARRRGCTLRALSWCNGRRSGRRCPCRTCSVTYLMTSSRRFMQKSMSKSGIDTRSGFRKRSNSRLYGDGIDVGDAQRVRDQRAGARAAARARPGCRAPWPS